MRSILFGTVASLALVSGAANAAPGGNGHGNENHGAAAHGGNKGANAARAQAQVKASGPARANVQARVNVQARAKAQAERKQQARNASLAHQKQQANAAAAAAKRNQATGAKAQQAAARQQDRQNAIARADNHAQVRNVNRNQANTRVVVQNRNTVVVKNPPQRQGADRAIVRQEVRREVRRVAYTDVRGRQFRVPVTERVRIVTERRPMQWRQRVAYRNFDGCPPGLARKYNGCMPPGLAKARYDAAWDRPNWYYNDFDRSYRYRYADGYMLRMTPANRVVSYVPLLGGALAIGQAWPTAYEPVALPDYYNSYYDLGAANSYRAYGDAIYRVNGESAAITSIAALLTGNDITIGQPMPVGYEVYNVPYSWRSQYYDTPDAMYRYSDGYIYQLDPTTRLVQAAIELLA